MGRPGVTEADQPGRMCGAGMSPLRQALMAAAQLARSADLEHYAETCDSA
jgi:hypothetical protein